jgi:predicted transcriptional regulator
MSLIPTQHVEPRDTVSLRLDHAIHERLEQYAAFIESPKHYVVAQALERLFRSDKGFLRWLAERPRP